MPVTVFRLLPHAAAPLCALFLAACAVVPDRGPRPALPPAASLASTQALRAPQADWPQEDWWKAYADDQLDALMEEALAYGPTLAQAEARWRQAQAVAGVTAAADAPQLSTGASLGAQRQSRNDAAPAQALPHGWRDDGQLTLDFSWELDFWGRNRAAVAAATSEAEAALADAAQARLLLTTAVASQYAQLALASAAVDTARAALEVRRHTAELLRSRYDHGLEVLGNVRQVEARQAAAAAELRADEEQVTLRQDAIAALLGAGPDRGRAIERPSARLVHAFGLPETLPAHLVGRRPDLTAARLRAEAAARRIDAAERAFYPDVNLMALIGLQSLGIERLARSGSVFGSAGPAISLPLFDGGRLRGQLNAADAEYDVAVAEYRKDLAQALQEVADSVASQQSLGDQLADTGQAVDAARAAWTIQNQRYAGGLATYLDVLSAEDYLLGLERSQTDLQSRSLAQDIALVRALGGGYSTH